jgi:hypothetical protein
MADLGYSSPQEGAECARRQIYSWLLFRDGLWYSPKDKSGLSRIARVDPRVLVPTS